MSRSIKQRVTESAVDEDVVVTPTHEIFCFSSVVDYMRQQNKKLVGRVASEKEAEQYIKEMSEANPNNIYESVTLS